MPDAVGARALLAAVAALAWLSAAGAAAEDDAFSLASLGVKGTAVFKNFSHFDTTRDDPQLIRNEGLVRLELNRRLAPWSDAKVVGELRKDDDDLTDGVNFQVQEKNRRRSLLDLKEAVLTLRGGPLEAGLGKQIYAWGTADTFNPTDNLNAYDYLDVIDNEKLGLWSAALRLTAAATTATFVVVPAFVPSRLPLPRSRWMPSLPAGFVGVADDPEVPRVTAGNLQYAARVRTTARGVDVSASYYDGFEHVPALRVSSVAVAPGVVLPRFTPVYPRVKVPGLDVSTTYGGFELHAETAARFVESNGRDDRWQGIAGFNYTWESPPLPGVEQIAFLAEYAREITLRSRSGSNFLPLDALPGLGDLVSSTVFREALIGRALVKLSEDTQVKLTSVFDLDAAPNAYVQSKVTHRLTDALQVEAGLDLFAGEPQSHWGRFRQNNRVFVFVKYFF